MAIPREYVYTPQIRDRRDGRASWLCGWTTRGIERERKKRPEEQPSYTKWKNELSIVTHDLLLLAVGSPRSLQSSHSASHQMNQHSYSLTVAWIRADSSHKKYTHTGRVDGEAGRSSCFSYFSCGVVCLALCVSGVGPGMAVPHLFGLPGSPERPPYYSIICHYSNARARVYSSSCKLEI